MTSFPLPTYRLIPGIGLGDSLLFLPAAWALVQRGHPVIFHSKWLYSFKDCLYPLKLEKGILFSSTQEEIPLSKEEIIVIQNHSPAENLLSGHEGIKRVGQSRFRGLTQGREIFASLLGKEFTPDESLHALRLRLLGKAPSVQPRTLAIHPTSQDALKNWPIEKYLRVAQNFTQKGWKICVFGSEKEAHLLPFFEKTAAIYLGLPLNELICKLAESELFLGNDSGLGHLASLAATPTITLFKSANHGKLWRPAWSHNMILSPFFPLPGKFRDHLWKSQLYTWQVNQALDKQSKLSTSHQRSL